MRVLLIPAISLISILISPYLAKRACHFDRYDPEINKKDPCEDIKLDRKKVYKEDNHYLELHVRLCQICEYNCDFTQDDFEDKYENCK